MKSVTVTEVPDEAQLIDVREPDEYAAGHAQHAINIPMSEFAQRVGEVDTNRDVYVICLSGGRSARVCEYLDALDIDACDARDTHAAAGITIVPAGAAASPYPR